MKRAILLASLGCLAAFAQAQNPLGGMVEAYKDAIRLRMEQDRIRALNEESKARAAAIRAQTAESSTLRENLDDADWTAGMFSGRGWRKLPYEMKVGLVLGFDTALFSFGGKNGDRFPNATYGEIVTALDRFYEKPENAALPIMMGLRAFTMKLKGSTDGEIETEIAAARKMISEFLANPPKKP